MYWTFFYIAILSHLQHQHVFHDEICREAFGTINRILIPIAIKQKCTLQHKSMCEFSRKFVFNKR